MEFKFLIDEVYLSSLFSKIDDNYAEIKWFAELNDHIPSKLGAIYITSDLLSKTFGGVDNAEIFFPSKGKARDLALKFNMAQQRFFKKYCISDFTDTYSETLQDFCNFILKNKRLSLITKFDYRTEIWWDNSTLTTFCIGGNALECSRTLASNNISCSDDEFKKAASLLFPNIYIHWSNKIKLENFNVSPTPMEWIVKSLSYLNDHAVEDYRRSPSNFMDEAFRKGVVLSPESTKTRRAGRMMKEREIEIDDTIICCEWHFKYSKANGGRIHFHFGYDVDEKTKLKTLGFPIVGIFAQHLSIE